MNKLLVIIMAATAIFGSFWASAQEVVKLKFLKPPGALWLQENTFIDETEVANINWLEYLYYLKKEGFAKEYAAALPDTTVWRQVSNPDSVYTKHYLRYPGFRFYPVVGITHRQAQDYCRWRTKIVNRKLKETKEYKKHFADKGFEATVTFRLPTEAEWTLAATAALDHNKHPLGHQAAYITANADTNAMSKKEKKRYFGAFNLRYDRHHANPNAAEYQKITAQVYYGLPNQLGLYGMYGNVAEMVAEIGKAKGGYFETPLAEAGPNWEKNYTKPQYWLGFRCVADVKVRRVIQL